MFKFTIKKDYFYFSNVKILSRVSTSKDN